MNLNKTLCEYIDTKNEGYVTVGMLLNCFLVFVIALGIGIGLLYSIYQGCLLIITGRIFDPVGSINAFLGGCGILLMSAIVILSTAIIISCVCDIKIARCEYKKDNE